MFNTNYSKLERHITCDNDCKPNGCPGHLLELKIQSTSAVGFLLKDGNVIYAFDCAEAEAIWDMLDFLKREG